MRRATLSFLPLAAAVLMVAATAGNARAQAVGSSCPDFEFDKVYNLDGKSLGELKGRLLLLEFWATW